jgi:transcriptional regulator with XRE-family HTH domain
MNKRIMTENSDILFGEASSDDAIMGNLGAQLKQMRLNRNLTQKQLGELSGLSRSAISDLENGAGGTMRSLVQLLRVLGKLEIFNHFKAEAPVSPIQIAKMRGKIRKRASGTTKNDNDKNDSEW